MSLSDSRVESEPTLASQSIAPPSLRFEVGSVVTPGDRLGTTRNVSAGPGTYARLGQVYASCLGTLLLEPVRHDTTLDDVLHSSRSSSSSSAFIVVVKSLKESPSARVLRVGDVVLGRVLRITHQQAVVDILAKHGTVKSLLPFSTEGQIQIEDARMLGSTDEARLQDLFLPGDLVLARILGLGDTRRYLLTTLAPELGVVYALSQASNHPMIPLSWKEMKCEVSGHIEPRKVAKPRNENSNESY